MKTGARCSGAQGTCFYTKIWHERAQEIVERSSTLDFRASSIVLLSQAPRQTTLGDCSHRAQSHSLKATHRLLIAQRHRQVSPSRGLQHHTSLEPLHLPFAPKPSLSCIWMLQIKLLAKIRELAAQESNAQHVPSLSLVSPRKYPSMCPLFPANHPHVVTPALEFQFYAVFENTFQ